MRRTFFIIILLVLTVAARAQVPDVLEPIPDLSTLPQIPEMPSNGKHSEPAKPLPDSLITFKDLGIKSFCLRQHIDTNNDREISLKEAEQVKSLSFMVFKSFIRFIRTYDDLCYFPNLEQLHAGTTNADTLDLRHNPKLTFIDCSNCRKAKVIILAEGCKPEIKEPEWWQEDRPVILYVKPTK